MPIRLSGLTSGLDTDAIVQELVSAYSMKSEKYEKSQTKLGWKQDAWKSLNTQIYSLYTNVSNLRLSSAYNMRKTSVSDITKASIKAAEHAPIGTQKLNVLELAQAGYITGGKLASNVKADTDLAELGYYGKSSVIEVEKNDGTKAEVKISKTSKISDVIKQFNEAGINASYDEKNRRIFLSSKESGVEGDFTLRGKNADADQALRLLGLDSALVEKDGEGNLSFTAAAANYAESYKHYEAAQKANLSVEEYVQLQVNHYKTAKEEKTRLTDLNKTLTESNDALKKENESLIKQKEAIEAGTATADPQMSLSEIEAKIAENNQKIEEQKASIETNNESIKTQQKLMDENQYGAIVERSENDTQLEHEIQMLVKKAEEANKVLHSEESLEGSALKIAGSDAVIKLNGVTYTSSENKFSVNGLNIDAMGVTGDGDDHAITISVTHDSQGMYDQVKDFLMEYNNVVNEMTKLYNANSAGEYEPLTDEEKEAMSEKEIEKWEDKIKNSLLRRDTTLNSVLTAMTGAMSKSIEVDGEMLSLSSFGISTLGFLNAPKNEHYAYHIDGDEDDKNASGKEDKLMKAITDDPDKVAEFMQKLTANLYTAIDEKMKSTSLSSAYKVYNDKEMDREMTEYKKNIAKWDDKIKDKEDYYYKKFAQMEAALATLQNQTNSLGGLFGQ